MERDMAPRDAYRTDPMFLQYSEVAFKSQLKKRKDANGMSTRQPPKRPKEPSFCQRKYDEKQLITFIYYNTVTNRFFSFSQSWHLVFLENLRRKMQ